MIPRKTTAKTKGKATEMQTNSIATLRDGGKEKAKERTGDLLTRVLLAVLLAVEGGGQLLGGGRELQAQVESLEGVLVGSGRLDARGHVDSGLVGVVVELSAEVHRLSDKLDKMAPPSSLPAH
jgi:hypothetical protein